MKILVIQQKMIGDVLTSSILFEALRKKYPTSELHYLIHKHTFPVVQNNPFIDKCVLFDPKKDESPEGLLALTKKIRGDNYDVVIDVYSKIGTAFLTRYSGAEKRISYRKWYTSAAYTDTFSYKKKAKTDAGLAIENRMLLLQALAPDFPLEIKPKIYLKAKEKAAAKERLREHDVDLEKPLIMCNILGSSPEKTYPIEYMVKVLDHLVETTDAQLLFNYIPRQKPEVLRLFDMCSSYTRNQVYFNLFGRDLRDFMALTYHCDALIGNEGGAVNIAKALDVPTFAIFSPQIEKQNWSLYEDGKTNVSVHLADFHPSLLQHLSKKNKLRQSAEAYKKLEPEMVFPKLEKFLNQLKLKE